MNLKSPTEVAYLPSFDLLPDDALVRAAQLVRNPKHPNRPAPIPISQSTLWRGVASGEFPQPVKLSSRVVAFRVGEIRAWVKASQASNGRAVLSAA